MKEPEGGCHEMPLDMATAPVSSVQLGLLTQSTRSRSMGIPVGGTYWTQCHDKKGEGMKWEGGWAAGAWGTWCT